MDNPAVILTLLVLVKGIAWGGSAGIVIWLASHYGDQIERYKTLNSFQQRTVMAVVAVLISWLAYVLVTYLPDTFWQAAEPYFLIASMAVAPILAGQGIYLARRVPPLIADMNRIRSTGMIVPDDHPARLAMQARVQAEAEQKLNSLSPREPIDVTAAPGQPQ